MNFCSIESCGKKVVGFGYCNKHYARFKRHGDPNYVNPKKSYGTPRERFENKFKKSSTKECWEWLGNKDKCGYGRFFKEGKLTSYLSHRFSYELYIGDIDEGYCVCHLCDNTSCVNPSHLFLGTHKDNMNDRDNKKRCQRGEKSGVSKLKEEDVKGIRESNLKSSKLEIMYGVSRSTISLIKSRKSWRHIK